MKATRSRHLLFSLLGCCLIILISACGSGTTQKPRASPTPSTGQTPTASTTPTTAPVSPTLTSCPAPGTARAAVTAPLAQGSHQNIVYIGVQSQGATFVGSTLKRYDVSTGNTTDIVTIKGMFIDYPQVSADGQWLLFVARYSINQQHLLQMVRMDGQGLQTLYCVTNATLDNVLWSSNQKLVIFSSFNLNNNQGGLYLLHLATGTIQLELKPAVSRPRIGFPVTWLDNTRQ